MKTAHTIFRLILSILIASLFVTSCSEDIELSEENEQTLHTVKMTLNGSFVDYDGASTRASSREWKNGETLYLEFATRNGYIYGQAVYDDSNSEEWLVSYYGNLDRDSEMSVEVMFFDNPSLKLENNVMQLTPFTPSYESLGTAIYTSGEGLSLTATLYPWSGRIRFKGQPGENIAVGGISFFNTFELDDCYKLSSTFEDFVYITVNESGYTDYLYSCLPTKQIKIKKQEEDGHYLYSLDFEERILTHGASGRLTIPAPTSHNGWTRKQVSGEENGYLWVDLGLPSGTKWAADNVGADIAQWQEDEKKSNVFGEDYYWGETSIIQVTENRSERHGSLSDEDIQGSDEDTVKYKWGGAWIMPSKTDYEELIEYCTLIVESNSYGEISALKISGPTGMSIWIPFESTGSSYWTSTPDKTITNRVNGSLTNVSYDYMAWALIIDAQGEYSITSTLRCYRNPTGFQNGSYRDRKVRGIIKS